jgi:virginiamycin B lyase
LVVVVGLLALAWRLAPSSAAGIVEYRMLDPTDIPTAVAVGPDGAVWFTIDFSDAIGVLRDGRLQKIPKGRENLEPLGLAVDAAGNAWYADPLAQAIGRVTPGGSVETFTLPAPIARLGRLAVAPDGAVWFADVWANSFTRLEDGRFAPHPLPSREPGPFGVAVDASGTVWGTLQSANQLVRIAPDGQMTALDLPTRGAVPSDVAVDASGAVWFLETRANKIGRFAEGRFAEFAVPTPSAGLVGLAVAPDGAVWFAEVGAQRLGRLRDGAITEFTLPHRDARPFDVAVDALGNVWYTDLQGRLGKLPTERAAAVQLDLTRLVPWPRG